MRRKGRQKNNYKNHHGFPLNQSLGETPSIPEENVIDLKKMQAEKYEAARELKLRKPFLNFLKSNLSADKEALGKLTKSPLSFFKKSKIKKKTPEIKIISESSPETPIIMHRSTGKLFSLKHALVFLVVALLLVMPFYGILAYQKISHIKGKVLGESFGAYEYLKSAGNFITQNDYNAAVAEFDKARNNFISAQKDLSILGDSLKLLSSKARSADYLLKAGEAISRSGSSLAAVIDSLNSNGDSNKDFSKYLSVIKDNVRPLSNDLQTALDNLDKVKLNDLPENQRGQVAAIKEYIPSLRRNFDYLLNVSDVLLQLMGQSGPKRYLVIFENNRELRPNGGFIGSVALMDIYQGKIKNLEVPQGGSYDIAGQLKQKIVAPKPLQLVNPYWNIQDANWFSDFPTSAQKVIWFYEKSGGSSVDGVIAFTPTAIENLLKIVGPIDMTADYNVIVTDKNFVRKAQEWAEIEYKESQQEGAKPKKFIADLVPVILNKLTASNQDKLFSILSSFDQSLASKQMLLYFNDQTSENRVKDLGFAGEIKESDKDYLGIISTNIGGGKTDHVIDQLISHQSEIQSDGSIVDTVWVTRIHHGDLTDRWESVRNVSYLRFYVPSDSQLMEVSGFEDIPSYRFQTPDPSAKEDETLNNVEQNMILDEKSNMRTSQEFNKTVFGSWISVGPGEANTVMIKYRLPFKLKIGGLFNQTDTYSLLLQKQPGMLNDVVISKVVLSDNISTVWTSAGLKSNANIWQFNSDLEHDEYFGMVLKKK